MTDSADEWPDIVPLHDPAGPRIGFLHPGDGFEMTGWLDELDGRLALREVTVRAERGQELSTRLFRYRVGQLVAQARRAAARHPLGGFRNLPTRQRETWDQYAERMTRAASRLPQRRDRRSKGEAFYHGVAVEYLELLAARAGDYRGLMAALAERRGHDLETVRVWVRKARTLGFLTPAQRGRGGAERGPRLEVPDE